MSSIFDADYIKRYTAVWHPCENGVHVFYPEGSDFGGSTVKNFEGAPIEIFRQLSSCDQENSDEWDLMCDEHRNGDLHETVGIRRQDLPIIERALGSEGTP